MKLSVLDTKKESSELTGIHRTGPILDGVTLLKRKNRGKTDGGEAAWLSRGHKDYVSKCS